MDILGAGKVLPVLPSPLVRQALLHKADGNVQKEIQVRHGKLEVSVLRVENPVPELLTLLIPGQLGALVGNVGIHVAVQQDGFPLPERLLHERRRPVTVFRKQKGHQLGVHGVIGAKIPPQETGNEVSVDRGVITGEMDVFQSPLALNQIFFEPLDLGGFARPVKSFEYNEHS